MPTIPTTTLQLDLPLRGKQIRHFRAAIIEATDRKLPLLHNKDEKGKVVYRYPQVQYRVRHGMAAAWAVGKGTDQLRQWLFQSRGQLNLNGRERKFRVLDWQDDQFELKMLPNNRPQWYYLSRWMPLNNDRLTSWTNAANLTERIGILENMLAANILAFAREIEWQLPEFMHVHLQQIMRTRQLPFHNNSFYAFDVVFTANVALPRGIGLGHAVSHGHGIATPVRAFDKRSNNGELPLEKMLEEELEGL